jgi:ElaB/YqjD/DUF883 family membrane-anchored ribosome-binding protein
MDPETRHIEQTETTDEREAAEVDLEVHRARIEETRAEMGETIDAIKERLNPHHLAEQAKETVREATIGRAQEAASHVVESARETMSNVTDSARDAGSSMMETIKQNPMPLGIIGLGLAWLYMSNRKEQQERQAWHGSYGYDERRGRPPYPLEYRGETYQAEPSATEKMGQAWHEAQSRAGEVAGQVQEKAGEMASRAQHKVSELGTRAASKAHRAEDAFQQMLYRNPVAAGAVAMGLGAAIGLMIPETDAENRIMGEARDQLVDRAQEKAQDVKERAQSVAQEAMHAAKETAREEARQQGLQP